MAMKDIPDRLVCEHVQRYKDACAPLWDSPTGTPWPPYPYESLAAETGQPEKVCYRALERAADRGLIEYGVSLRTGWLTEKGKALLA